MSDDIHFETRFSRSRGLFPYVLGLLGLGVLVLILMVVTGVGVERLPYYEYFKERAPLAADGSAALSLLDLSQKEEAKTVTIAGGVMNRTESPISGLTAVIKVSDKFTLLVATVNAPIEPAELPAKGMGSFQITVPLGDNGFGGYTLDFRLREDGPFVPHVDERPVEPTIEIQEIPR